MPVTAKLSKAFYERLGEDIANELVDWFNQVDATYRSDLRDLNELNFARFDSKLEQRVAALHAKLDTSVAELHTKIDASVVELHTKIDASVAELHARIDLGLAEVNARMEVRLAEQTAVLQNEIRQEVRGIEKYVAAARTDLIKWTFVFWATTALGVIGMMSRFQG